MTAPILSFCHNHSVALLRCWIVTLQFETCRQRSMAASSLLPLDTEKFGYPWPEFNDGLYYNDVVRSSDSGLTLLEFYSSKYKSSAPLQEVGSKLVYHRLPWKEPDAPYMIEVLFEDDDLEFYYVQRQSQLKLGLHHILLMGHLILKETVTGDTDNELGKIAKIYRVLVSGIVENDKVIINQPIGTIKYPGVAKGLCVPSPSGAFGTTFAIPSFGFNPEGHTKSAFISFIGHPQFGDPLYTDDGQPKCFDYDAPDEIFAEDGGYQKPTQPLPGDCGYYLHAHQLVISHPKTNEVNETNAPVPTILQTHEEGKALSGA